MIILISKPGIFRHWGETPRRQNYASPNLHSARAHLPSTRRPQISLALHEIMLKSLSYYHMISWGLKRDQMKEWNDYCY